MEAFVPVVALIALGMVALRYGFDARPALGIGDRYISSTGRKWTSGSPIGASVAPIQARTEPAPLAPQALVAKHLVWAPLIPAHHPGGATIHPTLDAIDSARGPGQPAFAVAPNAASLEQRARELTDRYWSEHVWLTGLVDQHRFDAVCAALERERQVELIVLTEEASAIAS